MQQAVYLCSQCGNSQPSPEVCPSCGAQPRQIDGKFRMLLALERLEEKETPPAPSEIVPTEEAPKQSFATRFFLISSTIALWIAVGTAVSVVLFIFGVVAVAASRGL